MIEFSKLEVENFGPYKGIQELNFGRSHGVWIVYGANGRGKTSLLNAFRFALYGEMRGRISEKDPSEMVNTVAREEAGGLGHMRVTLEMVVNGSENWEITRIYDENRDPPGQLIVSIDNDTKTANQGARELEALLPPDLSEFFLFDGEDLREYEHLLEEDSAAAERLREAIERVLGIPTLHQAAGALGTVKSEATKMVAEHMKRHDATREAGERLQQAQEILDEYEDQLETEQTRHQQLVEEKDEIEQRLRQHERAEAIMERLDVLRDAKGELEGDVDAARDQLREVTPDLWKVVLKDRCSKALQMMEERQEKLRTLSLKKAFAEEVTRQFENDGKACPVCGSEVSESDVERILNSLPDSSERQKIAVAESQISEQQKVLRQIVASAPEQVILDREDSLDTARLRLEKKKGEIEDVEDDLEKLGEDERTVRDLKEDRDEKSALISSSESTITKLRKNIEQQKNVIPDLREKANRSTSKLDPALESLEKVSGSLQDLFEEAADVYRDTVRDDIEKKASDLFVRISAEPDYKALRINDSYGLEIIDQDGSEVPNRAAGYEHLVAISLLAALQSLSPNRGPVVVDSPFQRLDATNTSLVMGALPDIANQTLLLVFEKQFDRKAAIKALKGDLIEEFELSRISARETEIEVRSQLPG